MPIQPFEFFKVNSTDEQVIGAMKLNVIKYISRDKGSRLENWQKARQCIDMAEETLKRLEENDYAE